MRKTCASLTQWSAVLNTTAQGPNDQASEEMQICILLILKGCNTLPAWQHSHVIARACTLMFRINAGEIFSALPGDKKDLPYINLCHGIVEASNNFSSMHSIINGIALLPNALRHAERKHRSISAKKREQPYFNDYLHCKLGDSRISSTSQFLNKRR